MFDSIITLISEQITTDSIGFPTATETTTDVLCKVGSVSRNEYFDASKSGLAPEYVFDVATAEYGGQKILIYEGERYGIYRTYLNGDITELYAEYKGGVTDGN